VARELASHLRLKQLIRLDDKRANGRGEETGFSSEIETAQKEGTAFISGNVARELASHLRLKQHSRSLNGEIIQVARELASHLRLKRDKWDEEDDDNPCGEGTGFSSEIETSSWLWYRRHAVLWRGNWLLI